MFILTGWWTLGAGNAAYHEHNEAAVRENRTAGEQTNERCGGITCGERASGRTSLIEELREEGLVSEEEYESKREDIIQDL